MTHEQWRQLIFTRDSGLCQWHLVKEGVWHAGTDPHHIKTRGAGGKDVPENGILLCRQIHNDGHGGVIRNFQQECLAILMKRGIIKQQLS